jgi:hypothetical protein
METELTPEDMDRFHADVADLAARLATAFNAGAHTYHIDDATDTLYVSLKGLEAIPDEEIEALAIPILDDLDLDFEDIILLPLD